jgi:hypothetical protein
MKNQKKLIFAPAHSRPCTRPFLFLYATGGWCVAPLRALSNGYFSRFDVTCPSFVWQFACSDW